MTCQERQDFSTKLFAIAVEIGQCPKFRGGMAVCGHTRDECIPMYETRCRCCGHPISWHKLKEEANGR